MVFVRKWFAKYVKVGENMAVGQRIKYLREQRNWSQLFLAEKMYMNNSVLSRIEAGKRDVEDGLLGKFADVFEVSGDYLLGRTDDPKFPQMYKTEYNVMNDEEELTEEERAYLKRSLDMFREIKAKYTDRNEKKKE